MAITSSNLKPRIFPIKGTGVSAEIDRAQSIDPSIALNREKLEEIGTDGVVGYLKKSPAIGYRLTQNETGNVEFFQKLANNESIGGASDVAGITLNSFKTPYFDIAAYLTDDDDNFIGTAYYPALRTSGFEFSIGDPQAKLERSFDFVGEAMSILQGDNKYLVNDIHTAGSGDDNVITLSKTATVNPDVADEYQLRVVRITSGGTVTELSKSGGDYTEDATTLTITSITTADTIKCWFTSSSAPDTIFTTNTSDVGGLIGDCADIYLYVPASGSPSASDYVYKLQSVTIGVTFDREDLREIGNKNVVSRSVKNSTVSISLGRVLENFKIEEVLRGVSSNYGILNVEKLTDSATLIAKIYDDNTKTTFKYGYLCSGLSPMDLGGGVSVNENVKKDVTLEGEDLTISANPSVIGI